MPSLFCLVALVTPTISPWVRHPSIPKRSVSRLISPLVSDLGFGEAVKGRYLRITRRFLGDAPSDVFSTSPLSDDS